MVKFRFGITKFSSMPITFPYPSQVGHAPIGLLNEKKSTVGSAYTTPSSSNLLVSVCLFIVFSNTIKVQIPFPSLKAAVEDSIILDSFSLDWEQVIRSIIKSAFSNSVFGLEMASLIEIISPLKKSLLKPCSIKIFNCFCVVLPFGMTNGHEINALVS